MHSIMVKYTQMQGGEKECVVLKAIIVDDEAPARSELRYMLDEHGQVEVVAEAASVREAIEKLLSSLLLQITSEYTAVGITSAIPGIKNEAMNTAKALKNAICSLRLSSPAIPRMNDTNTTAISAAPGCPPQRTNTEAAVPVHITNLSIIL